MSGLAVFIGSLLSVALLLFAYVGWRYRQKRQAMEIITIAERKRLQQTSIVAATILFSGLVALGTVAASGA